jgi:hypothetical protein
VSDDLLGLGHAMRMMGKMSCAVPVYRVTVTASYPPDASEATRQNLNEWASADHDRSLEISHETEPVRITAKAVYRIDARSENGAEREAEERFAAESVDAGIAGPESVIAAADKAS